jgi:hypothetical protein
MGAPVGQHAAATAGQTPGEKRMRKTPSQSSGLAENGLSGLARLMPTKTNRMKIFLSIDGGLGNQLFEYAFGRALAIRTGGELILDLWKCQRGRCRPFELHHFNIRARSISRAETVICRLANSDRFRLPRGIVQTIAPGMLPRVVSKKQHGFDPKALEQSGSVFADGWWQSELYFREHRQAIVDEFTFREAPDAVNQQWLEKIGGTESVCLHVRRGDYVTDPYILKTFGICGLDYYKAAIELIQQKVASPTFFIFSNDPEWAKQNLSVPGEHHFATHNCDVSDWEDLRLMSACRHFVVANSTFSWWGAWLSGHEGKMVIAPRRWFAAEDHPATDIVPTDWIAL